MSAKVRRWLPAGLQIRAVYLIAIAAGSIFPGSGPASERGPDDKHYPVSAIPTGLRKEADAVIRLQDLRFEVRDKRLARIAVTKAVTVFTEEGKHYGELSLSYDRFRTIGKLEGHIYDGSGTEIRELESDDVHDFSAASSSLYEDERERSAELSYDRYPYTVEFVWTMELNGYLGWPGWVAQESDEPVELSTFEVSLPADQKLRYIVIPDSVRPNEAIVDGRNVYRWEARNRPELSKDDLLERLDTRTTVVRIAPSSFEFDGRDGDMSTWKSLGSWMYDLYRERADVPEAARAEIRKMIAQNDPTGERVRKVYEYMQGRTRYVSVQLGIGGWQPFGPEYVHERRYGDCKALSNYTVALLREAGVGASPVLIRRGSRRDPFYENFPSNQFNHVIVCVPAGKDSIWLECTSQSLLSGRLMDDTQDRYGLLIGPAGGIIVRTPSSIAADNLKIRKARVVLMSTGTAKAGVVTTYTGDQQADVQELLSGASAADRQQWIDESVRIPNVTVESFQLEGVESHGTSVAIHLRLSLPRYSSETGSRLFFQPNLMEKRTTVPPDLVRRRSPVVYEYPFRNIDTIMFRLPPGYRCEALPKEVSLTSPFASFVAKAALLGDTSIVYTRKFEIRTTSISPDQYKAYRAFLADVVKSDRGQAVLAKQ